MGHDVQHLGLSIGNNQGMLDVEYGKVYDIYFPPQQVCERLHHR
jgi:hypothetical protein